MKFPRRVLKHGRVEMIPMIDTILILLIFYMSFSSFSKPEKQMDAQMAESRPLHPGEFAVPLPPEITIHVKNSDVMIVNGVTFMTAAMANSLKTLGFSAPDARIIIEADAATSYQAVINALDACARAKLSHLTIRPLAS